MTTVKKTIEVEIWIHYEHATMNIPSPEALLARRREFEAMDTKSLLRCWCNSAVRLVKC